MKSGAAQCRFAAIVATCLMMYAASASASFRTVWRDGFEEAGAMGRWNAKPGFGVVEGEGLDGGRCLLWEESSVRQLKTAIETESDNEVRNAPPSGVVNFTREFPVEAGRKYRVSFQVKGAVTNNCGYVFFQWYDRNGNMLGRTQARPALYKDVGARGWETITAESQRLPSDAARGELCIRVYNTTLGRMLFDDFEVKCDEFVPVEAVYSSAYRDEAECGVVKFVVPYSAPRNRYPTNSLSGTFSFAGERGRLEVAADTINKDFFEASVDVELLAMGTHAVKAVLRCGENMLGECMTRFTRLAKPSARRVRFDARGRALVDGKPFFALGVYVHPQDHDVRYIDRLCGGPFNCVIECDASASMLDKFHSAGLMAIPKSPLNPKWAESCAKRLRMHPALLAWYVIDETPVFRADDRRALHQALDRADPDHPTFAVLAEPRNASAFMGAFDIISADPYPVGFRRLPLSISHLYARECRRSTCGVRPVWQVPQAFAWDWCAKRGHPEEDRYPTYDELRSMAWQGIAGGANGLLWYSAHQIFKNSAPGELEENWRSLVNVAKEIRSRFDVLLSDEPAPDVFSSNTAIAVRAFRKDGMVWLLSANTTAEPVRGEATVVGCGKAPLDLPPLGVEFVEVKCGACSKGG